MNKKLSKAETKNTTNLIHIQLCFCIGSVSSLYFVKKHKYCSKYYCGAIGEIKKHDST